jgi:hypothetical protein
MGTPIVYPRDVQLTLMSVSCASLIASDCQDCFDCNQLFPLEIKCHPYWLPMIGKD